jgi:hypothetical protein
VVQLVRDDELIFNRMATGVTSFYQISMVCKFGVLRRCRALLVGRRTFAKRLVRNCNKNAETFGRTVSLRPIHQFFTKPGASPNYSGAFCLNAARGVMYQSKKRTAAPWVSKVVVSGTVSNI